MLPRTLRKSTPWLLTSCLSLASLAGCGATATDADDSGAPDGSGVGGTVSGAGGNSSASGGAGTGEPGSGGSALGGAGAGVGGTGTGGDAAGTGGGGGKPREHQPGVFVHPGILVNQGMLDFVKAKITAGQQPWKGALDKAKADWRGSLSYTPHARAVVECGSYSNPDIGCSDEKNDAVAAYTHALLWVHTGNEAYAKKAIQIMNAWSAVLTDHTNSNAPLQSAWVMETFPRAAEIIRYTYDGWSDADIQQFADMLTNVYQPMIENGVASNGNWETSMAEGTINIAVFNDDETLFQKGVKLWRERTPAYLYLTSDGDLPVPPPRGNKDTKAALIGYWYNQSTFVDGLCQETCRDLGHTQYGIAGIVNAAETALIQGIDLYSEQADRIRNALGFHAKYLNGAAVPSWLCGGSLNAVSADPMWEIGYNHFATRLGNTMAQTQTLVNSIRPTGADHHMDWETLTHGDIGWAGLE